MKKIFFLFFLSIGFFLEASVNFVLFTQPKTGTHLLIPILTHLTKKNVYWAKEYIDTPIVSREIDLDATKNPQDFYFSLGRAPWSRQVMDEVWGKNLQKKTYLHLHAPYTHTMELYLYEKNCILFFIQRDPRDQIISLLNHYKYIECHDVIAKRCTSDSELLLYLIQKKSRAHTLHFMGWLQSPLCCALDFNRLMGDHGGAATDHDALLEMRKIATALQIRISDSDLLAIYQEHFGKGWNFFRGKAGVWKEYFQEEHIEAAKAEIGDLLIELGYERDLNW